jgi:hypothetical protein
MAATAAGLQGSGIPLHGSTQLAAGGLVLQPGSFLAWARSLSSSNGETKSVASSVTLPPAGSFPPARSRARMQAALKLPGSCGRPEGDSPR